MLTASFLRGSYSARSTLCRSCLLRSLAAGPGRQQTRSVAQKVKEKNRLAQVEWDAQAIRIAKGEMQNPWDLLRQRGFVKDIAGTDPQIRELMRIKRIGAYVGIDPTAPSLHLGHLLPLMPLFWMYMHGYRAISVVGGATAKIGDPTDRLKTRDPISKADLSMNITKIHYQLKRMWLNVDAMARRFGYEKKWAWRRALLNNSAWHNQVPMQECVSRLFKGMRLGPMLSRDTVQRKLNEGDGMSLAEFVYPLIQAWDWWHLFSGKLDINMQIGGSDQYGNIITGLECVKYLRDSEPDPTLKKERNLVNTPVGFTVPLLTDSTGAKFGKTAGNAVWLDPFQTSPFHLYGYLMRRPDDDVERLLKLFTFFPLAEIGNIMTRHEADPSKRIAQHALAREVVTLVHGVVEAERTQAQHKALFSGGSQISQISSTVDPNSVGQYPSKGECATSAAALSFRTDIQLPRSLIMSKSIGRILFAAGLADSVTNAHRLVVGQGAYIGGSPGQPSAVNKGMSYGELTFTPVKNWFPQDTANFLIDGKLLILRRGKHFIRVVEMVSDEDWIASGKTYPGEPYTGALRKYKAGLLSNEEQGAGVTTTANDNNDDPSLVFPSRSRSQVLMNQARQAVLSRTDLSMKEKSKALDDLLIDTKETLEKRRKEEEEENGLEEEEEEEEDD
ncbi:tRNA synthetase class I [Biscogniauxia mediterranea]|nr:tRNA synthetase class I [Biscogniauxia mediterranea]